MTHGLFWRRRPPHASVLAMAILSMVLVSCGSRKDLQTAQQAVSDFHSQLNSEQYNSIYAQTSEAFRKATNETDFTALLQVIHRKLGKSGNSQRQNFRVNFSTGQGEVVSLEYHTDFEGGAGDESFLWQFAAGRPMLLGYHINSNALILK